MNRAGGNINRAGGKREKGNLTLTVSSLTCLVLSASQVSLRAFSAALQASFCRFSSPAHPSFRDSTAAACLASAACSAQQACTFALLLLLCCSYLSCISMSQRSMLLSCLIRHSFACNAYCSVMLCRCGFSYRGGGLGSYLGLLTQVHTLGRELVLVSQQPVNEGQVACHVPFHLLFLLIQRCLQHDRQLTGVAKAAERAWCMTCNDSRSCS